MNIVLVTVSVKVKKNKKLNLGFVYRKCPKIVGY